MKYARLALALVVVAALAGCSSPDEKAHEFGVWASTLEYVASVDAQPGSSDGLVAHLVVDGAITSDELVSLAETLSKRAASQQLASPEINLIVGNAWGFIVDDAGVDVATINTLRDDPLFVGATILYRPLDASAGSTDGLFGTVGSQAALRDAPAALAAAYTAAGGSLDSVPLSVSTANGAFGISGEGTTQPENAIQLWQAISGRVTPLAAHATAAPGAPEQLIMTVGSADEKATAESFGAQFPDVELTVSQ